MKKLVLMLAVIFSVSLVSCGGNKAAENAEATETVVTEVVEDTVVAVPDSNAVAADTTGTVVVEEAAAAEVK